MSEQYYIVESPGYGYGFISGFKFITTIKMKNRFPGIAGETYQTLPINSRRIRCNNSRKDEPMFVVVRDGVPYEFLTGSRVLCINGNDKSFYLNKKRNDWLDICTAPAAAPTPGYIRQCAKKKTKIEFTEALKKYTDEQRAEMAGDLSNVLKYRTAELIAEDNKAATDVRLMEAESEANAESLDALRPGSAGAARSCPYCNQTAAINAKTCPHCGRTLIVSEERKRALLAAMERVKKEAAEERDTRIYDMIPIILVYIPTGVLAVMLITGLIFSALLAHPIITVLFVVYVLVSWALKYEYW